MYRSNIFAEEKYMKQTMPTHQILVTIVVALIVGAVAFFGGMKFQQHRQPAIARQFGSGQGRGQGGNRMGFRPVSGEILSSDDKSITVKLADGSSKIILLTSTTIINKADTATVADLKTGEKVAVFGQENTDGSISAQSIQLNLMMRMGGQGAPSPTPASK